MTTITITIHPGRRPAPHVSDPLLSTAEALQRKGRHVLYDALPYIEYSVESLPVYSVDDGMIVRAIDPELGDVRGQCTSIRHRCEAGKLPASAVTLRVPR